MVYLPVPLASLVASPLTTLTVVEITEVKEFVGDHGQSVLTDVVLEADGRTFAMRLDDSGQGHFHAMRTRLHVGAKVRLIGGQPVED